MVFKWRDEHTTLMLTLIQNRECLWNKRCPEYNKKSARDYALHSLIQELNIPTVTVSDVKAKIKTIRTRYASELAKIRRSEINSAPFDDVYVPRLFWFPQADAFLRNVCVPRRDSNLHNATNAVSKTEEGEEEQQYDTDDENIENESTGSEPTKRFHQQIENHTMEDRLASSPKIPKTSTGFNQKPYIENAVNLLEKITQQNYEEEHEFDVFCKSLAIQLKNMPLRRALICQERLQSVMVQERLSQLECEPSSTYGHSTSNNNSSNMLTPIEDNSITTDRASRHFGIQNL